MAVFPGAWLYNAGHPVTGDDLTDFATEGRFMIGNLSARTNCTVVTTDER
jgi:hypothetical protein